MMIILYMCTVYVFCISFSFFLSMNTGSLRFLNIMPESANFENFEKNKTTKKLKLCF